MFKANPTLAVSVDTPEYANIKEQIAQIQQKYTQVISFIFLKFLALEFENKFIPNHALAIAFI